MKTTPQPFRLDVAQETQQWIADRVRTARIIPDVEHGEGKEWSHGVPSRVMEDLVEYWRNDYDWEKVQAKINSTFQMFTVELREGDELINLHFVHHRSTRPDAVPLLFAHGWPGNFLEVESLLKFTEPDDGQAFHIIAPSLPGFTFSSEPKADGFNIIKIASLYHKLMQVLGYDHYIAQGGDWGSFAIRSMAMQFPESCIGIHTNFIFCMPPSPFKHPIALLWLALGRFTPEEKKKVDRMKWWFESESGYMHIQSTKPQTISYGLLDSPIGMLAWIREKLEEMTGPDYVWDKETVITWVMLYLLSNSAGHARIYKGVMDKASAMSQVLGTVVPKSVAVGASSFPYDTAYATKWWAQTMLASNIVFWREHSKGGHLASVEVPDLFLKDIQDFFQSIPAQKRALLH